jgi:uncharacterized membrane protein YqiK
MLIEIVVCLIIVVFIILIIGKVFQAVAKAANASHIMSDDMPVLGGTGWRHSDKRRAGKY